MVRRAPTARRQQVGILRHASTRGNRGSGHRAQPHADGERLHRRRPAQARHKGTQQGPSLPRGPVRLGRLRRRRGDGCDRALPRGRRHAPPDRRYGAAPLHPSAHVVAACRGRARSGGAPRALRRDPGDARWRPPGRQSRPDHATRRIDRLAGQGGPYPRTNRGSRPDRRPSASLLAAPDQREPWHRSPTASAAGT